MGLVWFGCCGMCWVLFGFCGFGVGVLGGFVGCCCFDVLNVSCVYESIITDCCGLVVWVCLLIVGFVIGFGFGFWGGFWLVFVVCLCLCYLGWFC